MTDRQGERAEYIHEELNKEYNALYTKIMETTKKCIVESAKKKGVEEQIKRYFIIRKHLELLKKIPGEIQKIGTMLQNLSKELEPSIEYYDLVKELVIEQRDIVGKTIGTSAVFPASIGINAPIEEFIGKGNLVKEAETLPECKDDLEKLAELREAINKNLTKI